jgi:hypothetical protein
MIALGLMILLLLITGMLLTLRIWLIIIAVIYLIIIVRGVVVFLTKLGFLLAIFIFLIMLQLLMIGKLSFVMLKSTIILIFKIIIMLIIIDALHFKLLFITLTFECTILVVFIEMVLLIYLEIRLFIKISFWWWNILIKFGSTELLIIFGLSITKIGFLLCLFIMIIVSIEFLPVEIIPISNNLLIWSVVDFLIVFVIIFLFFLLSLLSTLFLMAMHFYLL